MKILTFEKASMSYPVGNNMIGAIAFCYRAAKVLVQELTNKHKPINIFVRGSSGAIVGALLSSKLIEEGFTQVKVSHIKKEGEKSHGGTISGFYETVDAINIIMDDFIATGKTINAIYEHLIESNVLDKNNPIDYLIVNTIQASPSSGEQVYFIPDCLITGSNSDKIINIFTTC